MLTVSLNASDADDANPVELTLYQLIVLDGADLGITYENALYATHEERGEVIDRFHDQDVIVITLEIDAKLSFPAPPRSLRARLRSIFTS